MFRLSGATWANTGAAALIANVCLGLLPFAAVNLAVVLQQPQVYGFPATRGALRATRAEIERAAVRLLPERLDRRRGWEELIARELNEGDPHAARGFVLAAPALLGPIDVARINRGLSGKRQTDAEIARAAAPLLSNETRGVFADAAGWMARADVEQDPAAFLVEGATQDFAVQAEAWMTRRDPDHLALALTGVRAALGERLPARLALGASTLKDARRAGRLGPVLTRQLESRAAKAVPPARLRAALAAATAQGSSRALAFRQSLDQQAFAEFTALLGEIGDMAAATSSRGAARLIAQARDESDLPRLRLVAQAAGDRAVALAKRMSGGKPLADSAHGTLTWTRALVVNMIALVAIVFAGLGAAAIVLANAWFGQQAETSDASRRQRRRSYA
jgi:hypothetical protein